jgi:hypothetical protein
LDEHAEQFATFLTYAALEPVDTYTAQDFRTAFHKLPQEGLHEAAHALVQALEGAGEQREEYWANRIQPFWQRTWPKSSELASKSISESLARLCIAARDQFPAALAAVRDWLQPTELPDLIVRPLHESGLSGRFPENALELLNAIIDDQPWAPRKLGRCLAAIVQAAPALLHDRRYRRLDEYAKRHGA